MTRTTFTRILAPAMAALLLAPVASTAGPKISVVEDAIEAHGMRLALDGHGGGDVTVRRCPQCDPVTLPVTAATKAYEHGSEVPLSRAALLGGTDVVVFFRVADGAVTRITW